MRIYLIKIKCSDIFENQPSLKIISKTLSPESDSVGPHKNYKSNF